MKAFVLVAVLLLCGSTPWLATRAGAQGVSDDSCYTLSWPSLLTNPDSVLVDTCLSDSSHTVLYIRGGYIVAFAVHAISLPWAPSDSDVEVTWEAIDTVYPTLRAAFDSIQTRFGTFTLKKEFPSDTSDIGSQDFYLIFSNYIPYDSITPVLDTIEGVSANFNWPSMLFGVKEQPSLVEPSLYPNPAQTEIFIQLNGESVPQNVELIDPLGRVVEKNVKFLSGNDVEIPLMELKPGMYFVKIGNTHIPFIHIN